jgi:hypothetical protein
MTIDWVENERGCWDCSSHSTWKDGYPLIKKDGRRTTVGRVLYEECFGLIPVGMVLRHKCNNRRCINPEHLTIGTDLDNFNDRRNAGTWPDGEKNGAHKLTIEQVRQIRKEYRYGLSLSMAQKYGVSRSLISGIANRTFWKSA